MDQETLSCKRHRFFKDRIKLPCLKVQNVCRCKWRWTFKTVKSTHTKQTSQTLAFILELIQSCNMDVKSVVVDSYWLCCLAIYVFLVISSRDLCCSIWTGMSLYKHLSFYVKQGNKTNKLPDYQFKSVCFRDSITTITIA